VEFGASCRAAPKRRAKLGTTECAVRHHQDAARRGSVAGRRLGRGFPKRAPSIRVLGGDLPEERADDSTDKQRHADEWIEERTERD
jgi:hypothetical protein